MLGELFLLLRSLDLQGLGVARVHRDFDAPSTKSRLTLRVKLDNAGRVRQISLLPRELEPALWTLKNGNHSYFPAVRTDKTPLLRLNPDDAIWVRIERSASAPLVEELCKAAAGKARLDLRAISQKQAARVGAWRKVARVEALRQLHEFVHGFQAFAMDPAGTASELLSGIERSAMSTNDPTLFAALAAVIVGQLKKANGKSSAQAHVEYGAQLVFDFWSDDEPSFSLYSHAVREAVLDALLAPENGSVVKVNLTRPEQHGVCALTGEPAALLRAPFPGWAAKPVISKSLRPFDKFSAAP